MSMDSSELNRRDALVRGATAFGAVAGFANGDPRPPAAGAQVPTSAFGWLNVRDVGAVGDGTVDDTAAIQQAIDRMGNLGGAVVFPPGRYRVTQTLSIRRDWVMLLGSVGSRIDSHVTQGPTLLVTKGGRNTITRVMIRDLYFSGLNHTGTGAAVEINRGIACSMEGVTLLDFNTSLGVLKLTGGTELADFAASNVIKNLVLTRGRVGVFFDGVVQNTIIDHCAVVGLNPDSEAGLLINHPLATGTTVTNSDFEDWDYNIDFNGTQSHFFRLRVENPRNRNFRWRDNAGQVVIFGVWGFSDQEIAELREWSQTKDITLINYTGQTVFPHQAYFQALAGNPLTTAWQGDGQAGAVDWYVRAGTQDEFQWAYRFNALTLRQFAGGPGLRDVFAIADQMQFRIPVDSQHAYHKSGVPVVGDRRTGWDAPRGRASRGSFDPSQVSLRDLAERVKALVDDLMAHGLIGE